MTHSGRIVAGDRYRCTLPDRTEITILVLEVRDDTKLLLRNELLGENFEDTDWFIREHCALESMGNALVPATARNRPDVPGV